MFNICFKVRIIRLMHNILLGMVNMGKFLKILLFLIAISIVGISVTFMIKGLPVHPQIIEKVIENEYL